MHRPLLVVFTLLALPCAALEQTAAATAGAGETAFESTATTGAPDVSEAGVVPAASPRQAAVEIAAYERAIDDIEQRDGAYGAELTEALLGLGLALQSEGLHGEALDYFKRGVHLARVNDGLYSARQIPLLKGEISSHLAIGDYGTADERQRYLYRVQTRALGDGAARTAVYMDQARWQYQAYELGVGQQDYSRLMNMWDLYRLALQDVMAREGDASPDLLPPLQGMLQTQYLIAAYDPAEAAQYSSDDMRARQDQYRFSAYQSQNYQKGEAVIESIISVEREQPEGEDRHRNAARALAMMGDWHLFHGRRSDAGLYYAQAFMELEALPDAQAEEAALFGAPVALPDVDGARTLPPAVDEPPGVDVVQLQFSVSDSGRVFDLERLDDNEALDGRAYRLMRELRQTRFRPRLVGGEAVETSDVVRAYRLL